MGETSTAARPSKWHRLRSKWYRVWPGLVPFALPVIYYAIIGSSVFYLLPLDQEWPALDVGNFKHEGFEAAKPFAVLANGYATHAGVSATP
jgi:hypothetical protein